MTEGRNEPAIDAEEIVEGIREWVTIETPSHDGAAVNRLVDVVERQFAGLGARIERTPGRDGFGDILLARAPWGEPGEPGILVLSHLDTVHPLGSLDGRMPWRREGDTIYAPGIYDMKGGAYLAYYAWRHLVRQGRTTPLPVTFLFVPEEEVGSPTSRDAIEQAARNARYVLVTEPGRDGGKCVIGRKGAMIWRVTATGRASHAGMRHQDGRSAIREMARQILEIESFTDYERGITANVGLVSGGSGVNVVPAACVAEVDIRVPDPEAAETMLARMRGLAATDPDVGLVVEGGLNRPPYDADPGIMALFEHARTLAAEVGIALEGVRTGGGSDGNFTAALGIPNLDGIGVDGAGAHALDEHMDVGSLEQRARLWVRLFETLR